MGSSVRGTCSCGLKVEVAIGGGMMNFSTTRFFPCLCEACNKIVEVNLLAKDQQCPECQSQAFTPYDDPRMSEAPGKGVVASWDLRPQLGREVVLTDGSYRCPNCRKMSLHFKDTGLRWD